MKLLRKFFMSATKGGSLPLSVVVLALLGTSAHADRVVMKLVPYSDYHPTTAITDTQSRASPAISLEQLKALGLLDANGKLVVPGESATPTNGKARLVSRGNLGGPVLEPAQLLPQRDQAAGSPHDNAAPADGSLNTSGSVTPMNYGEALWPYTTSRVQLDTRTITSSAYPYRASGKLLVTYSGGSFWCSATLIKKGLLVTAAHCVASYGQGFLPFFSFTYYPGIYKGKGAYGSAAGASVAAMGSYLEGRDNCASPGFACENDIAIITLRPKRGKYIGSKTGWMGYGMNGWGFADNGEGQLAQLGYPDSLDSGQQMIRTDSSAEWMGYDLKTHLAISFPDAAADGGPWVANLGIPPAPNNDVFPGNQPYPNVIVGVTSWWSLGAPNSPGFSFVGASPFTSDNIGLLVDWVCSLEPAPCDP